MEHFANDNSELIAKAALETDSADAA